MPRYELTLPSLINLAGGLMALATFVMLLHRRRDSSARMLAVLTLIVSGWGLSATMEIAATDLATTLLWCQVSYVFIALSPVPFALFGLRYGRQRTLSNGRIWPLLIIPVITIAMAWTNARHGLLWSQVGFDPATNLGLYSYGPWFYVFVAYTYGMIAIGLGSLIAGALQSSSFYLPQRIAVLVASFISIAGNLAYLFRLGPWPNMDLTPTTFAFMSLILALSIQRYHLFDLQPVVRSKLLEVMQEAVLVIDERGRVVDYNQAMAALSPQIAQNLGQLCCDFFPGHEELTALLRKQTSVTQRVRLPVRGETRMFEVSVRPLKQTSGRARGHLVVLYDITEEHRLGVERDGLLADLRDALHKVQELGGMLPICAHCKKIRDDQGFWHNVETYLQDHSQAELTEAICPECQAKLAQSTTVTSSDG